MATLVVYADVADADIGSSDSSHATAVAGSGLHVANTSTAYLEIGDSFFSPTYYINEIFLSFDTSALPDDATIDDAVLDVYGNADNSSTDFTIECAAYDYGASLTTADWIDGTDAAGLTVLATRSTAGWSNAAYNAFSSAGDGLKSVISKTGNTRLALWPERVRTGSAPANSQFVRIWSADEAETGERRPRLTITYTEAAAEAPQSMLGWGLF